MKIVYIAHPIGGNIEENLDDLRRIIRKINLEYPDITPFVPYYADIVSLDDNNPEERDRGIRNNMEIIIRGIPDEVWMTGIQMSHGMREEMDVAMRMFIPVINKIGLL